MFRYLAVLGGAALALAASVGTAGGAAPEGPRLAYVRAGPPLPAEELLTVDPLNERPLRIARGSTSGSFSFEGLSWSGDGTRLAVGGPSLVYTVPAEGGTPRAVPGTRGGYNPVFSPDGQTIAFAKVRFRVRERNHPPFLGTSIWIADLQHGRSRQLTPWRNGLIFTPGSFSPDGTGLAAVRGGLDQRGDIVLLRLAGGRPSVIVRNGIEPAYSPDGSRLAFIRLKSRGRLRKLIPFFGGDLFVSAADGSNVERLTFTPGKREASPSWDPSAQRLAFTQFPAKRTFEALVGIGSAIFEINSDGTCRHRLLFTYGLSYRDAEWQPGPGRGAERITC
jgi:Tol biopolymer transport system component